MKCAALFALFASAQAARVGLLRLSPGAEVRETAHQKSVLQRSLFEEDYQL